MSAINSITGLLVSLVEHIAATATGLTYDPAGTTGTGNLFVHHLAEGSALPATVLRIGSLAPREYSPLVRGSVQVLTRGRSSEEALARAEAICNVFLDATSGLPVRSLSLPGDRWLLNYIDPGLPQQLTLEERGRVEVISNFEVIAVYTPQE